MKSALKDALTARLDEAVKDKRLTEAEKNRILRNIDDRLDAIVNGKRPDGPPGPFKRRWR